MAEELVNPTREQMIKAGALPPDPEVKKELKAEAADDGVVHPTNEEIQKGGSFAPVTPQPELEKPPGDGVVHPTFDEIVKAGGAPPLPEDNDKTNPGPAPQPQEQRAMSAEEPQHYKTRQARGHHTKSEA